MIWSSRAKIRQETDDVLLYPAICTETRAILHIACSDGFLRRDSFHDNRIDGLRLQLGERSHVWQSRFLADK